MSTAPELITPNLHRPTWLKDVQHSETENGIELQVRPDRPAYIPTLALSIWILEEAKFEVLSLHASRAGWSWEGGVPRVNSAQWSLRYGHSGTATAALLGTGAN